MESKFTVFDRVEVDKIKGIERSRYSGFVYIIEWGKKYIKIGSTETPYRRIKTLIHQAEAYGGEKVKRIAVSKSHTNFRKNELALHRAFYNLRKEGTELFSVTFDNALSIAKEMLEFLDETEQIENNTDCFLNTLAERFYDSQVESIANIKAEAVKPILIQLQKLLLTPEIQSNEEAFILTSAVVINTIFGENFLPLNSGELFDKSSEAHRKFLNFCDINIVYKVNFDSNSDFPDISSISYKLLKYSEGLGFVGKMDILDSTLTSEESVKCACTVLTENGEKHFYIYVDKESTKSIGEFRDEIVEKCYEVCKVIGGKSIIEIAYNLEFLSGKVLKSGNLYIDGDHILIKI